jgi:hypothetical protein
MCRSNISVPLQQGLFSAAAPQQPLVVAYGMGADSTAMLIGLEKRNVRPDLILFADTGGEKPETYAYLPVIQAWLRDVGFPPVEVVRYRPPIAPYDSLYGNCWHNETLPGLAFGRKSCAIKWKRQPQDQRVRRWPPAQETWDGGLKVQKLVGFEAGEEYRRYGDRGDDPRYEYSYPLMDWEWTRETCEQVIAAANLPVPVKSACYFCPAMKKPELVQLAAEHPDLYAQAIALEDRYLAGKHYGSGEGRSTRGLGRRFAWRDHGEAAGMHSQIIPNVQLRIF